MRINQQPDKYKKYYILVPLAEGKVEGKVTYVKFPLFLFLETKASYRVH